MTYPHGGAGQIWRDGTAGAYNPKKSEIRNWGDALEQAVSALQARDFTAPNPKSPVELVATANIALSGEQIIDGQLTATSRVLVIKQTDATQNGIYVTNAGAWVRAGDAATGAEIAWATVFVEAGVLNAGTSWICAASAPVIGVDGLIWVQLGANQPTLQNFNAALLAMRRAFEFDAERWFRPAFLTQNFAVTPVARSVLFGFETSAVDGQVYVVVLAAGAEEPGRAEIKAGTDGWGVAGVYAAQIDVGSVDVLFDMPRLLADATGYDIYAFHENAAGFAGIRHKASFTTPEILALGALDGSLGDLAAINATTLTFENAPDSNGGVNGIRFTDNGDTTVGVIAVRANVTLPEGLSTVRFKFKKLGGTFDYVMLTTSSYTGGGRVEVNASTGAILSTTLPLAPSVTDHGDGTFEIVAQVDATGWADRVGFMEIYMRQGGLSNVARDGTQDMAIHEFFVEAVL